MQLKKIAKSIGFTRSEFNVVLFLIIAFIFGSGINYYNALNNYNEYKNFNYAGSDSLLLAEIRESELELSDSVDKKFDYKQEVLDFSEGNFSKNSAKILPQEKSININASGVEELLKLPGIGEKTAEKIIQLREKKKGFKNITELMEVKGIGKVKFEKIQKYITIE